MCSACSPGPGTWEQPCLYFCDGLAWQLVQRSDLPCQEAPQLCNRLWRQKGQLTADCVDRSALCEELLLLLRCFQENVQFGATEIIDVDIHRYRVSSRAAHCQPNYSHRDGNRHQMNLAFPPQVGRQHQANKVLGPGSGSHSATAIGQ